VGEDSEAGHGAVPPRDELADVARLMDVPCLKTVGVGEQEDAQGGAGAGVEGVKTGPQDLWEELGLTIRFDLGCTFLSILVDSSWGQSIRLRELKKVKSFEVSALSLRAPRATLDSCLPAQVFQAPEGREQTKKRFLMISSPRGHRMLVCFE
jgi:hypothetical protein